MSKDNRPECTYPRCHNVAWWNVNNDQYNLCEKHFKGLVLTGLPILIKCKSIMNKEIPIREDEKLKKTI